MPELVNLVGTNFVSINQTLRGFDDRVSQELAQLRSENRQFISVVQEHQGMTAEFYCVIANALNEGGKAIHFPELYHHVTELLVLLHFALMP